MTISGHERKGRKGTQEAQQAQEKLVLPVPLVLLVFLLPSEIKAQLRLKLPVQRRLSRNQPEIAGRRASQIQAHRSRLRMIQHVGCIEPEGNALGLRDLDSLRQIGIKTPAARSDDGSNSHRGVGAGLCILKKDLSGLRVLNGVESTS